MQIIWNNDLVTFKLFALPIGVFTFFLYFVSFAYNFFSLYRLPIHNLKLSNKKIFIFSALFMLLAWLPFWIAEYPNSLSLDCLTQFGEIFNYYLYNNNNALILTLTYKVLFSFFSIFTTDINLNVALISIVFMIINSVVFSYSLLYCYKKTHNYYLYILFLFFYSFLAINVVFSIQLSKDTTFALSMILFVIYIDKFLSNQNIKTAIVLFIIGIFFSLLRYNGYYIVIATFIISLCFLKNKDYNKLSLIFLTIFLSIKFICYPCINSLINYANKDFVDINHVYDTETHYDENGNKLGISIGVKNLVTFQQVFRYVCDGYSLSEKQKNLLELIGPLDVIKEQYKPYVADPIMKVANLYGNPKYHQVNKIEYFKLYYELFAKQPFVFLDAYVGMTSTYYSPVIDTGPFGVGMSNNPFGFKNIRLISEEFTNAVENLYYIQYNIPIINTFLCPGAYTFFFVFAMFYFLKKKKFIYFIGLMPIMFNILILLTVVPINGDIRYYIPMSLCLPIILSQLLSTERTTNDNVN